jgi:asparagine synthase (glutamine-hydrolysing)
MVAKLGAPASKTSYWNLEFRPDYRKSEQDYIEELRSLLDESIRLHMVSDVPLGAFLSGGVDSSAIAAIAARGACGRLKTFSIGFNDQDYDELRYARIAANAIGTDHTEMVLGPEALECIEDVVWYLDEPFGDSSAIPTYMVSALAASQVKVVLSGDGGDELFGGYERYVYEAGFQRYRWLGSSRSAFGKLSTLMPDGMKGRRFFRRLALSPGDRYIECVTLLDNNRRNALFNPEVAALMPAEDEWAPEREYLRTNRHWLSNLQYCDLHSYLPLDILTKVDRMSMAHSIESRVPLLDHVLVEFAATIPPEYQLRGGKSKYLFKQALRGVVPDSILDRPKRGFAIPLGRWFNGRFKDFVRDVLLSQRSVSRGIFNPTYLEKMISEQNGRDLALPIWTLVCFELWCRMCLDHDGRKPLRRSAQSAVLC